MHGNRTTSERTRLGARLPLLMLIVAVPSAAFCAGVYVEASKSFPSGLMRTAYKTLAVNLDFIGLGTGSGTDETGEATAGADRAECVPVARGTRDKLRRDFKLRMLQCPMAHVAPADTAASRVEFVAGDALADPVLVKGEVGTFLDHCPAPWGCLAVKYSRSGTVSHAWPFRPDEIAGANIAGESDYPYEHPTGWSLSDLDNFFVSPYPSGDLLVVLQFHNSYPYGGGVVRVAPDGQPRWYRKDYSHHEGHVVGEDLALVPSLRADRSRLEHRIPMGRGSRALRLKCPRGDVLEDTVNYIGGDGELLQQVSILDAIVESPYATTLWGPLDPCDPTHLNFVHVLGADAGGADGIAPGDLVVSLRNLNAFAILDEDDQRLKKLVRGSFVMQHGVRHLDKARFIMYDNLGTDGVHGPSRLLIVDLATGQEITVFPNNSTPPHLRDWFTLWRGQFDISPDRRRALVAGVKNARAFEIRLADGEVLNVFRQMHELSMLPGFPEALTGNPWLFEFHGIYYANRWPDRVPNLANPRTKERR